MSFEAIKTRPNVSPSWQYMQPHNMALNPDLLAEHSSKPEAIQPAAVTA
ncbi:hypothetical protein [Rhizobium lusitanum]|uniref:Uncharacterized protein n=1 Tax=Rhizobium lusitanum TaxID=293958 RepID=A0A7X0IV42_9HYPH|nr:hypothetical protein [Rhizobium lusitanum]MBB6487770.1 hypothetical protein [Rhizobium lusitanum]